MNTRVCTRCQQELPFVAFRANPKGLYGLQSRCKECQRLDMQESRARRFGAPKYRIQRSSTKWNEAGDRWCIGCEQYLTPTLFSDAKHIKDGLSSRCKSCVYQNTKRWMAANPEKVKAQHARRQEPDGKWRRVWEKKRNKQRRERILAHYGDKCACCGETNYFFLSIDHINGGGYKHRKEVGSGQNFYKWLEQNDFPEGFQVLCFNCNLAKGHHGFCPHKEVPDWAR